MKTVLPLLLLLAALPACRCSDSKPAAQKTNAQAAPDDDVAGEAAFLAAAPVKRELPPKQPWDLPKIRERGTLRILVEHDASHFLNRHGLAEEKGRELALELAKRLGLTAEFVVVESFDALLPALNEGRGDIVVAELTVTDARKEEVAFSWPLEVVDEIVVGKKGEKGLPTKAAELAGRKVHVRRSSSYAKTLEALKESGVPVDIVAAPETSDPEELVYQVTRGERPLTVVDSHMLRGIMAYNPDASPLFAVAKGRQIAWGLRKDAPELQREVNRYLTERSLTEHRSELFTGDLEGIKKRGVLRVITRNNPVTYFMWRGQSFGFEYELMKMVADELGVRLAVVVAPSRDDLIPYLLEGRGDVIAASLTVVPERAKQVRFSRPYLHVDEVLVRKAGDRAAALSDLAGKKVHVRHSSSYFESLTRLGGVDVVAAAEDVETEELIAQVAAGEIPYTVADSHILSVELAWRDDVEPAFTLGSAEEQRDIAFAVRPGSKKLLAFLNAFVKREYRGLRYNMAKKRYFENKRRIAQVVEDRLGKSGRISPYDEIIKKYADRYGLDWRLLAAQAYSESRFDPSAKSWVGAEGLFQVMPATGRELGFTNLKDPDEGAHAGIAYLARLIRNMDPAIPFKQRVRFALAAYNAGIGHVIDARRIARERGWDPNRWFGHVEKAMLLLQKPEVYRRARYGYCRGSEPVKYVSEIQSRYDHFVTLVD